MEPSVQRILVGNLQGRDPLKDLKVDRRTILKCIKKIGCENVDWIKLDKNKV
jgi:hypothetical protein